MYKKGDRLDCNSYRGITLWSVVVKTYERILEKRLRREIKEQMTDSQSGFRKDPSIQNYVFTIKESIYSAFFLTVAIGNCMVKLIPPVNFCSDENIQTIFGTKLEDFLNYRIVYNSIS
jgi:hypothetical protein